MAKELVMWHGGRNLEYNYRENIAPKGRWDHGPGIYLSTSYLRAVQYAKGGGRTYKVTIEEGNFINDVHIPIDNVLDFVSKRVSASKRKDVLSYIHENMKRLNKTDSFNADTFLNIILNEEAIPKSKAPYLSEFLVKNGVDFSRSNNYGGAQEDIIVVFNKSKIKQVKWVPAKEVLLDEFDFKIEFKENVKIKKRGIPLFFYATFFSLGASTILDSSFCLITSRKAN